jgi:tetratricopeptide (TPR) repeat protein
MFVAGAAIGSLGFAEDAASLVRDGNRLYEAGKFADAAARYEQAASLDPESPVPLFNRAAALFQMGDFAAAAQLYEQARARAPESLRQKINFALGNSRLQQAIAQPTTPQAASQSAKEAASFYRDAIVSPPATASAADKTATNELSDAARFNLEIAKRLIKQLQAQQKQQPQDQSQHQNDDIKDRQDQQQPDTQGQSALRNEQPAPDKSDQQAQPAPDATEEQTQARGGAANQPFSPEDAAERLRSAIARAQMARSRRLTEEAKQAKAKAVEKDW